MSEYQLTPQMQDQLDRESGKSVSRGFFAKPFKVNNPLRRKAAIMLAAGVKTTVVASSLGVPLNTLCNWLKHKDFQLAVEKFRQQNDEEFRRDSIADKTKRLRAMDKRWQKLQNVIEARAADPANKDIPGGPDGLIVRRRRMIGGGRQYEVIEEYEVDTGLLREMRELENLARIETEEGKEGLGGGDTNITTINLVQQKIQGMSHDDLRKLVAAGSAGPVVDGAPGSTQRISQELPD